MSTSRWALGVVAFEVMNAEVNESADVQATFCATLVDEWSRLGVRAAFVSPGSRSTPIALALAANESFVVEIFHDERSAAFAALGASSNSGRPSLVVCTSGTAATHFHGAVVEADLAGVPLIVVTADRPPELQGVGAPQTIHQTDLYGSAAHWFHDPGVPDSESASTWRAIARRCVSESLVRPSGPVHLNLPFREPLVGAVRALPPVDTIDEVKEHLAPLATVDRDRLSREWSVDRPMLIAGRGTPTTLVRAARDRGWPVLAESRARRLDDVVTHYDSLVRCADFADVVGPDLAVRVGDPPASKVLGQWLLRHGTRQVHVSTDGRVFDPDHVIADRIVCDPNDLLPVFETLSTPDATWTRHWADGESAARRAVEKCLEGVEWMSGAGAVVGFAHALPDDGAIVVSSSMPIRDLEWFGGPLGSREVFSNRGANGIDGVLATAVGVARSRGGTVGVLIGDVAMLHDSSSLTALASRGLDIRILVIDNDGGGIFHHLPQRSSVDTAVFEKLYGTPHGTDFEALATAHGISSDTPSTPRGIASAASRPGPHMTIVRTNRDRDVEAHRRLHLAVARSVSTTG